MTEPAPRRNCSRRRHQTQEGRERFRPSASSAPRDGSRGRGGGSSRGRGGGNGQRKETVPLVLPRPNGVPGTNGAPTRFSSYWSEEETEAKLKLGQCFAGTFRLNVRGGGEGYVSLVGLPQDIMFRQGAFQNRAIVGDTIAFRILPTSFWWMQRSVAQRSEADSMPALPEGDMGSMDGPARRMGLLRQEIRQFLEKRRPGDAARVRLPVVWDHVESPEEAKSLIAEVLMYFPELRPTAEVVSILQPSSRRGSLVGVLQSDAKIQQLIYFLPLDQTLPKCFIVSTQSLTSEWNIHIAEASWQDRKSRTLIRATFLRWDTQEEIPTVAVKEIIGSSGDIETETVAILSSNQVEDKPFSVDVLECLPDKDWTATEEDLHGRLDLRSGTPCSNICRIWACREKCVFSIDPPTARDLDDALSIEKLDGERFRVGVHIADVSHFVKPGTAIDIEAQKRTTSVYLVQRVIPMLPELLSSHLCSLQPGEDRLTFSVVWEMDEEGEIFRQEIQKSIIHSTAKLAYSHAQRVIEDGDVPQPENVTLHGGHTWEEVRGGILSLFKVSQNLRRKRHENGALRLDLPKICFHLNDKGLPEKADVACQLEANHLIEEFMLLANTSVAQFISDMYPSHSILRCHPPPNLRLMGDLLEVAHEMKVELDVTTAATVQRGLWQLYEKCHDSDVVDAITNIATKPMQLAEYFCTGLSDKEKWCHYALAVDSYTHFTSPIRRYPDILVHRLLYAAITLGEEFGERLDKEEGRKLQTMADACNKGKMSARNAQDASLDLFMRYWLEQNPVETTAVVASVKGAKFFDVYVPRFALSTRIACEELPGQIVALFDKESSTLTIRRIEAADDVDEEKNGSRRRTAADGSVPPASVSRESAFGVHRETLTKGKDREKVDVRVAFVYREGTVSVSLQTTESESDAPPDPDLIQLEFRCMEDTVSVILHTVEPRRRHPAAQSSKKFREREFSAGEEDSLVDLHRENGKIAALQYPFRLSRFSKVPVKIWVKRDVTFGVIKDVQIDLIIANA